MSDSFERWNNDYIDDRTKTIINGYLRSQSRSIIHYQSFPKDINYLVLYYIDDYFMMYRGSYQWKINKPETIRNILSCSPHSVFSSELFEMSKLQWMIKLYPNGYGNMNGFIVFVKLLSMPSSWASIVVQQTIICHETNTTHHDVKTYDTADISS